MTIEFYGARRLELIAEAAHHLMMSGHVTESGTEIPARMLSADDAHVLATPANRPTYIKPH